MYVFYNCNYGITYVITFYICNHIFNYVRKRPSRAFISEIHIQCSAQKLIFCEHCRKILISGIYKSCNTPSGSCYHAEFTSNLKHLRLQGLIDSFKILTCDESCAILFKRQSWVPGSSQDHFSSALCFILELLREHFWPEVLI